MLLPTDVLSAQEDSSSSFLVFCTSVIFLHGMTTSSSLGYAGLVLPFHTDPTSPLLYLSEPEVGVFDMPNSYRYDNVAMPIFSKIPLAIQTFSKFFSDIDTNTDIFHKFLSDIDIDTDIFQKCRYIANRYLLAIY